MTEDMPSWAAWGSLAEEELASEAEALLRESRARSLTAGACRRCWTSTGSATTRCRRIRCIVGKIEVED